MLGDLEIQAKEQGLQFIEELIFENGAVYRGKYDAQILANASKLPAFDLRALALHFRQLSLIFSSKRLII